MVWLKLAICIIVILFAGQKVAKLGDIIAEKTGAGRVWMGVIAIALITSLPELFAGISAVTIVKQPDLTIGNLLGANAFNLLNLALLDIFHRHGSVFTLASVSHRVTAWYSLLLLAVVAAGIFVSTNYFSGAIGWIGWYTPVLALLYMFSVRQIFYYEKSREKQETELLYEHVASLSRTVFQFVIASIFIVGAGIWLAIIGDEIAQTTGWGENFVGSLFLAFTTTLPEIIVSFTALRIGAIDLAVANMIGSNMFNMMIITVTDLFYTEGPVLAKVSQTNLIIAGAVALMTFLFIAGIRRRFHRVFRLTWVSLGTIILFLMSAYFTFSLA